MATNEVKLTGTESWKAWNKRFVAKATTRDLWDLINPKSTAKGRFKTAPVKPSLANYPKRLDPIDTPPAQSTRSGSATSSATELRASYKEVNRLSQPSNTSEITTLGRNAYKTNLAEYYFEWRLYEAKRQNLNCMVA